MTFKNRDEAAGYLGAMIDGEGSVIMPSNPKLNSGASVIIVNTDTAIIAACCEAIEILGLRFRIGIRRPSKEGWLEVLTVQISHWDDFKRLLDEIPIRMALKRERLEELVRRRRDHRKFIHIDKEEFRRRYVDERWSTKDMALAYDIHPVYVPGMARKLGIPSRTRTEGMKLAFAAKRRARPRQDERTGRFK